MDSQEILLDADTNEVEMLELVMGGQRFAINVLKVRQLKTYDPKIITAIHLPDVHPAVMGTLLFRGEPAVVIDLCQYLSLEQKGDGEAPQVIVVCEFNNVVHGFLVDGLDQIDRIRWSDIQTLSLGDSTPSTASAVYSNEMGNIIVLDFEEIISDVIGLSPGMEPEDRDLAQDAEKADLRHNAKVLIVDDSRTMRKQIESILSESGYCDLTTSTNGEDAYEMIQSLKGRASGEEKEIGEYLDAVVTDIEMPKMDGLTLCKRIKRELPDLPVLILSSLISDQMALQCQSVSADGYLAKTESGKLIGLLDDLCLS